MGMILEKLKHFKKNQDVVEIGRRHFSESPILGQIRALSDTLVQVTEYDSTGRYNGISVFYADDITDLLWETRDTRTVMKLARLRTPFEVPELRLGSLRLLIEDIQQRFGTAAFLNEMAGLTAMCGEVISVDNEWVHILEYAPRSEDGRFQSMTRLDLITRLCADTPAIHDVIRIHRIQTDSGESPQTPPAESP
ncbi:hypothetical protein LZ24_02305 [Desulfobotulus alkaliphilus]|uniref:Uncharacterized protein n=1 Tax=Desulfobotulus alkaliphilus TaxID=622671 RepID=A0A562RMM7_9BACT|nr:hypothetical protein [Desulfobotulus alkaliphilus]TWI70295.1 hypothetical protein LZ24_02305 [Desulfobotulus alkaliphilus]